MMLTNSCQVQIDATSSKHFKYTWSIISRPIISDLKQILAAKLKNPRLFKNNKYNLYCIGGNNGRGNDNNRYLQNKEKFALKTMDQTQFYIQAQSKKSRLMKRFAKRSEMHIDLDRRQSTGSMNIPRRSIKSTTYTDNLGVKISKFGIKSAYRILLGQTINVDKTFTTLSRRYSVSTPNKNNKRKSSEVKRSFSVQSDLTAIMFHSMVEVQIDGAQFEHFKYTWNVLGGTHKLSHLRNALREKLRNPDLFTGYSQYALFDSNMRKLGNNDMRHLRNGEKYALKTNDGKIFYAQSVGTRTNTAILERLREDQKMITDEIERAKQLRDTHMQSLKHIEEKMQEQYKKMRIDVNQNGVEQCYAMIKTQKCKFDEKTDNLNKLNAKYQRIYAKLKKEHDRLQTLHFEGI